MVSNIIWLKALAEIPKGPTCYSLDDEGKEHTCPYWSLTQSEPHYKNGYCALLARGDSSEQSTVMLYDKIKACGLNP